VHKIYLKVLIENTISYLRDIICKEQEIKSS